LSQGNGLNTAADVSIPAEAQSQRAVYAGDPKTVDGGSGQTKPTRTTTASTSENDARDRWVIDSVETQPSAPCPLAGATGPKAAVEEIADVHDTLENAQVLPETDVVQLSGTAYAGSSSDVYRVVLRENMGSMTVSLANPGATSRGEKHLQVMDAAGNVYGDVVLGAPNSHLSISMHPRIPGTERTLYVGVFVVSNDAGEDSTPDPYALSITQRLVAPEEVVTGPAGQDGSARPAAVSTNPLIGSPGALIPVDSQPSPAQSDAPASPAVSGSIALTNVVNQTSATASLPRLVIAPDGGILSMEEGTAAYEQNATAVDLALIDLDFFDEGPIEAEPRPAEPDWQDDWEMTLIRPATGLPIAIPTLEVRTTGAKPAETADQTLELARLSPPQTEAPTEVAERKTQRWKLLQTGVGIATAAAFALLMPDATLMLHEPKSRSRRRPQTGMKRHPDHDGDL
jgi:hypothetical protein